jgi:nicotinamidase-related amidase
VTARSGALERWRGVVPDAELEVFRAAGESERIPIAGRVALLVVDVTYDFTGDKGDEHLASIAKFRASCGPHAWNAIPAIARLLAAVRVASLPTIYTRGSRIPNAMAGHAWSRTGSVRPLRLRTPESRERGSEIPPEIAPLQTDVVIEKPKASAFFATPLEAHLVDLGIDHVLIAGCTTSGCVRATVLDANYRNFGVTVIEEAVFDRSLTSHRVNLFEIDRKYANVTPIAGVLRAIANTTRDLSAASR